MPIACDEESSVCGARRLADPDLAASIVALMGADQAIRPPTPC